jgi:hypothetical protein
VNCPLCGCSETSKWSEDNLRPYLKCEHCTLIFVPQEFLLSAEDERKRYDTHENDEKDLRYRKYLTKIASGITPFLSEGHKGLDFGCGASTLMAQIMEESGYEMDSYDLYYHPLTPIWSQKYDFIILSEVIEHLSTLSETMERLADLLSKNGQFFIKTKFLPETREQFELWYYKKDPTHICFFNPRAMGELAMILGMKGPETDKDLSRLWF